MQFTPSSIDTTKGSADWFTGDAYIDPVAVPSGSSRVQSGVVHFAPGARTHWHTHEHGQTIYVTEGVGRCQRHDGPVVEIRPGDRVYFEPGESHWHGAAPNRFMSYVFVQYIGDTGSLGVFTDPVPDDQYNRDPMPKHRTSGARWRQQHG
jgi:quercetin dioxygenase-like cupin family protein